MCHQPIRHERVGVPMPPLKCLIFDTVLTAGDIGISSVEVRDRVYGTTDRHPGGIRVHVGQINELLIGSGYRIVSVPPTGSAARWFLRKMV
jgi:hypothetical protein